MTKKYMTTRGAQWGICVVLGCHEDAAEPEAYCLRHLYLKPPGETADPFHVAAKDAGWPAGARYRTAIDAAATVLHGSFKRPSKEVAHACSEARKILRAVVPVDLSFGPPRATVKAVENAKARG